VWERARYVPLDKPGGVLLENGAIFTGASEQSKALASDSATKLNVEKQTVTVISTNLGLTSD
jgi:hypothetical protein